MLEGFLRKILEKYLSDILEDVDSQEISAQLLKGDVSLDDVKIKPSFLKKLSLPFPFPLAFHRAVVGHLQLAVNWTQLSSQPLFVKLERIHLWAEAKAYDTLVGIESAYVQHQLAKAIQSKLDKLRREEEIRLAIEESGEPEGAKKPSVILARLAALVTTSLQLEINDIHVCISIPAIENHPGMHMGVAIEQIKFESTDSDWRTLSLHIFSGPTYKMLSLKNLSIYLNPDPRADVLAKDKLNKHEQAVAQQVRDLPVLPPEALPSPEIASAAYVTASLHQSHDKSGGEAKAPYQFLLKPTSLNISMSFNRNMIPLVEVHAIVGLSALQLTFTRPQAVTLLHLQDVVATRTGQVAKFIEKNPIVKPLTDEAQQRYVELYKRTLNALWLPELSDADIEEKETLERDLPYEELSMMRQVAVLEVKAELGKRNKVENREAAIAKRTHWWDSLFRSKESIKQHISDKSEPQRELTDRERTHILQKVRGEESAVEDAVAEGESVMFTVDDLMKQLTFNVTVELAVDEIGIELWNERDQALEKSLKNPDLARNEAHPTGENLIAAAAREVRQRENKSEPTSSPASTSSKSSSSDHFSSVSAQSAYSTTIVPTNVPGGTTTVSLSDLSASQTVIDTGSMGGQQSMSQQSFSAGDARPVFAGESRGDIKLRPYLRLQLNKTYVAIQLQPEGDVEVDAEISSLQMMDLTQCEAKDPWTAIVHPATERVEFGYIGPIVPYSQDRVIQQSVTVDPAASDQAGANASLAPTNVPGGIVLKLRRSPDALNSQERQERQQKREEERRKQREQLAAQTPTSEKKGLSERVTDIFFGPETDEDKVVEDAEVDEGTKEPVKPGLQEMRKVQTSSVFVQNVGVRSTLDVQVNNVRLSFTDSLIELTNFVRKPPGGFTEKEKEAMQSGDDVNVLNSAQQESDLEERRTGGEHKRTIGSIQQMMDPSQRQIHHDNLEDISQAPVHAQVDPATGDEPGKDKAKNSEQRFDAEKDAVESAVHVVPGQPRPLEPSSSFRDRSQGTSSQSSYSGSTSSSPLPDEGPKPPANSLASLKFFSPMLVRIHAPSPFISVVTDTAADKLRRLTFSLNATARALVDAEKDSIHARAQVSNIRGWFAPTQATQAISLAHFEAPKSERSYLLHPFDIGASFERYPSPTQQLLGNDNVSQSQLNKHFVKEVADPENALADEDLLSVLDSEKGMYHMETAVDISAIHLRQTASMWYMLQPLLDRIKRRQSASS